MGSLGSWVVLLIKLRSSDKDRLRFLENPAAAQVVAALLNGLTVDQVNRSAEGLLQGFLEIEKACEAWLRVRLEFDQ